MLNNKFEMKRYHQCSCYNRRDSGDLRIVFLVIDAKNRNVPRDLFNLALLNLALTRLQFISQS